MKRRDFLAGLGGAAASPLVAHAQQPMPVVGYLGATSPGNDTQGLVAVRQGLKDNGFVEGQNVAVEYRWAEGRYDQLPALGQSI